jgi:aldehyde:ferredoxin oxidoreductase
VFLDPLPEGNAKGKVVSEQEFEKALTEYYGLWGWDDQGRPTKATLEELGLGNLAR